MPILAKNACVDCCASFTVRTQQARHTVRCVKCRIPRRQEQQRIAAYKHYMKNRSILAKLRKIRDRENYIKDWEKLTDKWVKVQLVRRHKISRGDITPDMIDTKRSAMLAGRMVRKLWKEDRHGARFGFDAKSI